MPEISEEELQKLKDEAAKAAELEASKNRIIEESSKFKTRAQEAEAKLSESEKLKAEAEGDLQKRLDLEKKERLDLEEKLKLRTKQTLNEKVRSEVAKVAKDAHDIDSLLAIKKHKPLLKLDEEELSVAGIEEFVKAARESHPFMFGKKRMPNDGGGKPPGPGEGDPPNDHPTKSDDEKFREELKGVTSRAEQVKVYKKYGKPIDNYMLR